LGLSKKYEKKKVKITSGKFGTLTGKTLLMEKTGLICSNPLITQEKSIMENFGPFQK
jgi:hypothetical protein